MITFCFQNFIFFVQLICSVNLFDFLGLFGFLDFNIKQIEYIFTFPPAYIDTVQVLKLNIVSIISGVNDL